MAADGRRILQGDHMRRLTLLSIAALISVLAVATSTQKSTVPSSFSDREIFDGVVFGVGPVAQLVPEAREQLRPEIYAKSADELTAMGQVRASILVSIERAEPGLLAEFARVARSGDPAAIRAMLVRATEAVNAAAERRSGRLDGTLVANLPNPNPRSRPGPAPRPTPQLQQDAPLVANLPNPNPRSRPGPAPRPTPQLTAPQLAAQPAWALFSSPLFTEQLAGSMAVELERIEG
jgi:hypothetical protein